MPPDTGTAYLSPSYPETLPPEPQVREPEFSLGEVLVYPPAGAGGTLRFKMTLNFNGPCQLHLEYGIVLQGHTAPEAYHPILTSDVGRGRFTLEVVHSLHPASKRKLPPGNHQLLLRVNGRVQEGVRFRIPDHA